MLKIIKFGGDLTKQVRSFLAHPVYLYVYLPLSPLLFLCSCVCVVRLLA